MSMSLKEDIINVVGKERYLEHVKNLNEKDYTTDEKFNKHHNPKPKRFSCEIYYEEFNGLWIGKINGVVHCGFPSLFKTKKYLIKKMLKFKCK